MNHDTAIALQANFLATQAIANGQRGNFRDLFLEYKSEMEEMIESTPDYSFDFIHDDWINFLIDYKNKKMALYSREVVFKFSDNAVWLIHIVALANIRMDKEHAEVSQDSDEFVELRELLLEQPIELVTWAQNNLHWAEVEEFAECPEGSPSKDEYIEEWKTVNKTINTYSKVVKE